MKVKLSLRTVGRYGGGVIAIAIATLEREWHLHSSAPLPSVAIGWAVGLAAKQSGPFENRNISCHCRESDHGLSSPQLVTVVNDI